MLHQLFRSTDSSYDITSGGTKTMLKQTSKYLSLNFVSIKCQKMKPSNRLLNIPQILGAFQCVLAEVTLYKRSALYMNFLNLKSGESLYLRRRAHWHCVLKRSFTYSLAVNCYNNNTAISTSGKYKNRLKQKGYKRIKQLVLITVPPKTSWLDWLFLVTLRKQAEKRYKVCLSQV